MLEGDGLDFDIQFDDVIEFSAGVKTEDQKRTEDLNQFTGIFSPEVSSEVQNNKQSGGLYSSGVRNEDPEDRPKQYGALNETVSTIGQSDRNTTLDTTLGLGIGKDQKIQLNTTLESPIKLKDENGNTSISDDNLEKKKTSALGIFSMDFWQTYFHVNQTQIKDRLLASLNPVSPQFSELVWDNPDLYGPFWICSFLIFLLTVSGNFIQVFTNHVLGFDAQTLYNFENIGFAISIVYGALAFFPSIFAAVNKGLGSEVSLIYSVCVYGYSFTIFVIGSILCIIPSTSFRWIVMIMCCSHSICFMLTNFKATISKYEGDYKIATMALIAFTQIFLTFCFLMKFY